MAEMDGVKLLAAMNRADALTAEVARLREDNQRLTEQIERTDRAVKIRLVERAEHAERNLANADTVWRERHAHTSAQYNRQSRVLALHQARADQMESRAIKAERLLVRFGLQLAADDEAADA